MGSSAISRLSKGICSLFCESCVRRDLNFPLLPTISILFPECCLMRSKYFSTLSVDIRFREAISTSLFVNSFIIF